MVGFGEAHCFREITSYENTHSQADTLNRKATAQDRGLIVWAVKITLSEAPNVKKKKKKEKNGII